MSLTPATIRTDLKCGKGAISEGETCHVGPATKLDPDALKPSGKAKPGMPISTKLRMGFAVGYAGAIGAQLYSLRNARKAYSQKFEPVKRFEEFQGIIGDANKVIQTAKGIDKQAAPSIFGVVTFAEHDGKQVAIKQMGRKNPFASNPFDAMRAAGILSNRTADALIKSQDKMLENEVQGAVLAAKHGFGPKVVAADSRTLITEVANGRPLVDRMAIVRHQVKANKMAVAGDARGPRYLAKAMWNSLGKDGLSDTQKRKVMDSMAKMHSVGISHNDLHPGNIFITSKGAEFIDFGTSDRGGGSVASEFVRMMNPPRTGLNELGGMGYNLRTLDPEGYKRTESELRSAIGKRFGKLTSADIHAAVAKSPDKKDLEDKLQTIIDNYYTQYTRRPRTDSMPTHTLRFDKKCGASGIPENATCHKGGSGTAAAPASPGRSINKKAVAIGAGAVLGAGALTAGALVLSRRKGATSSSPSASPGGAPPSGPRTPLEPNPWSLPFTPRAASSTSQRVRPNNKTTPQIAPGLTPRALLPPARPPKSKTQRMRENTAASMAEARAAVTQTGREEVRRIAQIGNTMASAGEAAGNATKTTLRELRVRAEAARRRFEPGYRRGARFRQQAPAALPEGGGLPMQASAKAPIREAIPVERASGIPEQPYQRRKKARGFGRTDSPWAVGFSSTSRY